MVTTRSQTATATSSGISLGKAPVLCPSSYPTTAIIGRRKVSKRKRSSQPILPSTPLLHTNPRDHVAILSPSTPAVQDVVQIPAASTGLLASPLPILPRNPSNFGLIQERLTHSLYALLVQHILWNQTNGRAALPILLIILNDYPTPHHLSLAPLSTLTSILQPIGLHNIRAARLLAFANTWLAAPPSPERRYRRVDYPVRGCGRDVGKSEVLGKNDEREGWEVAHLPGMGAYALDGFRIFFRDGMRGVKPGDREEPEWMRVVPADKELRRYLLWRWNREGWCWDPLTGKKERLLEGTLES